MANYISVTDAERDEMLAQIGAESISELYSDVPKQMLAQPLALESGKSQQEVAEYMQALAAKNKVYPVILRGAGSYYHYIPSMVKNLSSRSEFLTAYTPYQAEMSQGILQSIFEYQSMICRLTGMDVSNASHYSGATAAAEACLMCCERGKNTVVTFNSIRPDTLAVLKTYLDAREVQLVVVDAYDGESNPVELIKYLGASTACVYVESPNYYGILEDVAEFADETHKWNAKLVVGVNPITLGVIKNPRELGADVAVGEAQPLGLPMSFGGPYLGFIACTSKDIRKMPGRIVGETTDANGKTCYVLTLQAREQHIRREKASSNICSNEAYCALVASMYLSAMGKQGLREVGETCLSLAHYFAKRISEIDGFELTNDDEFFHEFVTTSKQSPDAVLAALDKADILGGLKLDDTHILWCVTEMAKKSDLDRAVEVIKGVRV